MAQTKVKSELIDGGLGTDWQSAIKTSDFTAEAGKGYFINTTSGVITVPLPAGTAGSEIALQDYAGTFDTNKITITASLPCYEKENVEKEVKKYLLIFKNHPYVFNLGHGILPETKIDLVNVLINTVRNAQNTITQLSQQEKNFKNRRGQTRALLFFVI